MLTKSHTDYLVSLPKYIVDKNGRRIEHMTIDIDSDYDYRIMLQYSEQSDTEYNFLLRIKRSTKYTLKLTLHVQDNESKDCLIRIDYGATHTNPKDILDTLPNEFYPFAGVKLQEPHIHYNIDGYKIAAWALPLSQTAFFPKNLENIGLRINFTEAICNFVRLINVTTPITVNNPNKLFS